MSAQDYAINFPYGATSEPYSATRPHRGNDRPCPTGTPIVIGGTVIGLTGATGFVSGPHLHIQEHTADNYANVRKPQNEFKPGTVIGVYPNSKGDGTFGKFIDIQNSDGWVDSYCHLSQINVQVGQKVGEDMPDIISESTARIAASGVLFRDGYDGRPNAHAGPTMEDLMKNHVGKPLTNAWVYSLFAAQEGQNGRAAQAKAYADRDAAKKQVDTLGGVVKIKDGEIDRLNKEIESLKSQVGDNSKWEILKSLVRELIGK